MTKKPRRLVLARETLRRLTASDLSRCLGAADTEDSQGCGPHQTTDATQDTCNVSCGGTCANCPVLA